MTVLRLDVELADDDFASRDLFTDPPRPVNELVRMSGVDGLSLVASDFARRSRCRPRWSYGTSRCVVSPERISNGRSTECVSSPNARTR